MPSSSSPAQRSFPRRVIRADLFDRLRAEGKTGVLNALRRIAHGQADYILMDGRRGFSSDPELHAAVVAFVEAHGATIVRVPGT